MKKSVAVMLTMVFAFSIFPTFAYANVPTHEVLEVEIVPQVEVRSLGTDESVSLRTKIGDVTTYALNEGTYVAECSVSVYAPSITPRSSDTTIKEDNGITATLKITYLKNNSGQIKMQGISGSWAPTSEMSPIYLKNQYVNMTTGAPLGVGGRSATWYPIERTFDYSVTWGYETWYPELDFLSGTRGSSSAEFALSGMGVNWYEVVVYLPISIV